MFVTVANDLNMSNQPDTIQDTIQDIIQYLLKIFLPDLLVDIYVHQYLDLCDTRFMRIRFVTKIFGLCEIIQFMRIFGGKCLLQFWYLLIF